MNTKNYLSLLKDPKWQKKKNSILERDNYTCRFCGAKNKTLHVHHLYYTDDKSPWEYEDDSLITLCEDCHEAEHIEKLDNYNYYIALREEWGKKGHSSSELNLFLSNVIDALKGAPNELKSALQEFFSISTLIPDNKEPAKVSKSDIDYLYDLYPTKCPNRGRSTGKCRKDKEKIKSLLKNISKDELEYTIKAYVKQQADEGGWLKNFSTFLNQLPDMGYGKDSNIIEGENSNSSYIAKRLQELDEKIEKYK